MSYNYVNASLTTALRNMTSLRKLVLFVGGSLDILDRCTFKLEALVGDFIEGESLRKFLNSQPTLTSVHFWRPLHNLSDFEATCLPNLTQVTTYVPSLAYLIPGRPVSEVIALGRDYGGFIDLNLFTLSTSPILKLLIGYPYLYPKPTHLLASTFPSLTHLFIVMPTDTVRGPSYLFNSWILSMFAIDCVW
jgi:hypothetical protein